MSDTLTRGPSSHKRFDDLETQRDPNGRGAFRGTAKGLSGWAARASVAARTRGDRGGDGEAFAPTADDIGTARSLRPSLARLRSRRAAGVPDRGRRLLAAQRRAGPRPRGGPPA